MYSSLFFSSLFISLKEMFSVYCIVPALGFPVHPTQTCLRIHQPRSIEAHSNLGAELIEH